MVSNQSPSVLCFFSVYVCKQKPINIPEPRPVCLQSLTVLIYTHNVDPDIINIFSRDSSFRFMTIFIRYSWHKYRHWPRYFPRSAPGEWQQHRGRRGWSGSITTGLASASRLWRPPDPAMGRTPVLDKTRSSMVRTNGLLRPQLGQARPPVPGLPSASVVSSPAHGQ